MTSITGREERSDALVVFGATGDLAYKMIFPALYAMVRRGVLDVPVVGVAYSHWSVAQLRQRAADSIQHAGKVDDPAALARLLAALRYVDGDYNSPATFTALKTTLGDVQRPAHYLAIPPSLFAKVITNLDAAGLRRARAWSSKSPSGATSPPRVSSIASRTRPSKKTPYSASITSSARKPS